MPQLQLQASEQDARPLLGEAQAHGLNLVSLAHEVAPLLAALLIGSHIRRIWRTRGGQQR